MTATTTAPNPAPPATEYPTTGMTALEETTFHRARRAERFATAFGGFFWDGDPGRITDDDWFSAADALGVLMPSAETRAATMAILDVERGYLERKPPTQDRDALRAYYTLRKAARIAQHFINAGVTDTREATPLMWREARIKAGLTSNEAPSDVTRAAIAGIIHQRMNWHPTKTRRNP